MTKKNFFGGILCMTLVFGLLIAGCDTGTNGNDGGIDKALVANWHSTQAVADAGTDIVFEITADGRLIIVGQSSSANITVTTSGGRISATMTVNEQAVDGGSADYTVVGTTLRFSNLSIPSPVFTSLEAGQNVSIALGLPGCYYKRASGATDLFAGTWEGPGPDKDTDFRIVAANNNFKQYVVSSTGPATEVIRGTYTVSGNTVTGTLTQINRLMFGGVNAWVTYESLSEVEKGYVGGSTQSITVTGDTFTIIVDGEPETFYKDGGK
jgi:hypothetical protein